MSKEEVTDEMRRLNGVDKAFKAMDLNKYKFNNYKSLQIKRLSSVTTILIPLKWVIQQN